MFCILYILLFRPVDERNNNRRNNRNNDDDDNDNGKETSGDGDVFGKER